MRSIDEDESSLYDLGEGMDVYMYSIWLRLDKQTKKNNRVLFLMTLGITFKH
jgi:hypothetical protein